MTRSTLLLLCAAAGLAQTPQEPAKPPADVDQALRARVTEFIHYHVTGEFRKAEALVAEDTKDLFYNRNKPRYLQFVEIARIDYKENFTKAYVTVLVVSPEMIPGWGGGPPTLPIPTTWKIENGKWCYYLEPETFLRTPFGNFPLNTVSKAATVAPGMLPSSILSGEAAASGVPTPPPGNALPGMFPPGLAPAPAAPVTTISPPVPMAAGPAPDAGALAAIAGARQLGMSAAGIPGAVPAAALNLVKIDKTSVKLTPGKIEKITFTNTAPDARGILMLGAIAGVEAKLDHTELKPGDSAVLTIQAGKDAKSGILNFVILQTAEVLPIQISIGK